jgi:hypothetical protein
MYTKGDLELAFFALGIYCIIIYSIVWLTFNLSNKLLHKDLNIISLSYGDGFENKNLLISSLIFIIISLSIAGYFYYKYKNKNKKVIKK